MFGVQELYCNQFSYYKYDWLLSSHHQKTRLKPPLSYMYLYSLLDWLWFRVERTHELTYRTLDVTCLEMCLGTACSKPFPMEGFSLPPLSQPAAFLLQPNKGLTWLDAPYPPKKTQHPAALHESFGAVSWIKMKPFDVRFVLEEWYCWMVQKSG